MSSLFSPPSLPPTSLETVALIAAAPALLGVLAALAQQPGTVAYRRSLAPVFVYLCWRCLGGLAFESRILFWSNRFLGFLVVAWLMLLPRFLLSEPYKLRDAVDARQSILPQPHHPHGLLPTFRRGVWFMLEAHGVDFAPMPPTFEPSSPKPSPSDARPLSGVGHLGMALIYVVLLAIDGALVAWLFPSARVAGPSENLFFPAWLAGALTGWNCGLSAALAVLVGSHTSAAVCIGMCDRPRARPWGAPFDRPWRATSVGAFWAHHWHALLLPTHRFYISALLPASLGRRLRSALALVLAFVLTGILHDQMLLPAIARPARLRPSGASAFFCLQPVAILAERAFYRATGRRVGGAWGWTWTALWFAVTARLLVDAYRQTGMLEVLGA